MIVIICGVCSSHASLSLSNNLTSFHYVVYLTIVKLIEIAFPFKADRIFSLCRSFGFSSFFSMFDQKMTTGKSILRIFFYSLTVFTASSQFIENRICDSLCVCIQGEKIIVCNEHDRMSGLPTNIEKIYEKLTIQNGIFKNPILYQRNMTGLEHLNYLKIIYCKLTAVERNTFVNMSRLKYLDLSHNKLKIIESQTFSGLHLDELHLMENPGLQLFSNSFKEMTVNSINLRSNEMRSIQFDIFHNTNVKKLYLYNNRISVVDQKFSEFLINPGSIIDLTGNPLDCSCEMRWILPILKEKITNSKYVKDMKSINFTCGSPLKLMGKELNNLTIRDMPCPPAKIKSITVSLGIPLSELTCVAMGNNDRVPGISWNYVEFDNVRELRRTPLKKSSNISENLQTLSVKVKVTDKLKAFTCSSWLEETQMERIVVNIKAPINFIPITTVASTNQSQNSNSESKDALRPIPEANVIFKKQFTILEMVGAVGGTFLITLLLLFMLAQILRWWRRGQKPEPNYKSVNIIKPYWTLGHDSNNTYSHPVSHTEYDIPRTYETHAPSMCQSPPLSRGEYLDYKTQNKIYST